VYFLLSAPQVLGISASISGLLGVVLTSREIFRKGIRAFAKQKLFLDYGSVLPSEEEKREEQETKIDEYAKVYGFIIILISAFLIFFVILFWQYNPLSVLCVFVVKYLSVFICVYLWYINLHDIINTKIIRYCWPSV
jgi:Flp pilus assembly protein TadB